MSTGKRLAKRSILGTRVACSLEDGKYYPAVIVDVRSRSPEDPRPSIYTVRIENEKRRRDVCESELIGGGFCPMSSIQLRTGQKVFITHNNREVCATVTKHNLEDDEVMISIPATEGETEACEVKKRLEEVRLLESRKSARLADQDTDFAKLADVSTDRKRPPGGPGSGRSSPVEGLVPGTTTFVDVPGGSAPIPMIGSRKRRNSRGGGYGDEDTMDACAAALVLMKLSCSPRSTFLPEGISSVVTPEATSSSFSSSGVWSWSNPSDSSPSTVRSATPSPPLSDNHSPGGVSDDGIDMDLFDENGPRKRRSSTRTMFQCTWRDCREITENCSAIEKHIRTQHLGRSEVRRSRSLSSYHSDDVEESDSDDAHEEDFYWTEVEVNVATSVDSSAASQSAIQPLIHSPGSVPSLGNRTVIMSPGNQTLIHPPPSVLSTSYARQNLSNIGQQTISSSLPLPRLISANSNPLKPNFSQATTVFTFNTSPPVSPNGKVYPLTPPKPVNKHVPILANSKPMFGQQFIKPLSYAGSSLQSTQTSHYVKMSPQPTLSHMDMARPPHEDPEYRRQYGHSSILSSSWPRSSPYLTNGNGGGKVRVTTASPKASPGRTGKRSSESRKCRKVYGMDHREMWCTQCKWKKACTRFGE